MTLMLMRNTVSTLCLTIAFAVLGASAAHGGEVSRSKGNGSFVSVSGSDASGCVWSYLYVSKGGTSSAPVTWMYYDAYNYCSGEWIAGGEGKIANTALKVTKQGATLNLTAAAASALFTQGVTGPIQLTFTADGFSSYSYSGHSRSEYAGHVYQSHGSWTYRTATVSGTMLGLAVSGMQGSFGEGRDKYMEIERNSK